MKFHKTSLPGVMVIDIEKKEDFRGFFARTWCAEEFSKNGLASSFVQSNISFTKKKRTIRGFHYQDFPHQESKLIRCVKGRIFDVVVDLRRESLTYSNWCSVELIDETHTMVYIPEGCAHGFQTLDDDTEVNYHMSHQYVPESAKGIRWDDPGLEVQWPLDNPILIDRDTNYPDYSF